MKDPFLLSREWKVLRMRALERGDGKCNCCGRTAHAGAVLNVDHIKPRTRYPELALTLDNLQVLCATCNAGKGNQFETDWRDRDTAPAALMHRAATKLPTFDPESPRATPAEEESRVRQLEFVRRMSHASSGA